MSPEIPKRNPSANQVPVIRMDHIRAEQAWKLHRALCRMLADEPSLSDDPLFNVWRAEAFQRFSDAYMIGGGE